VKPLFVWLQRFAVPKSSEESATQQSVSSGLGEIEVEAAALLLAELASELGLLSSAAEQAATRPSSTAGVSSDAIHSVIQMCILLRLLGRGTESGCVKVAEVASLLEDAWLLTVPTDGIRVSSKLAACRYRLLLHVRWRVI
jgi:hypothetical protein